LKAFPLQIFQDGDGGNVRIPFTAGGVPVFSKNTRDVVHQFFACQTRVRDQSRREYTKHMLRLRRAGQITGQHVPEIILLNS
ncbi:hypothetical protein ACSLO3_27665, partial [Escherichia coli]